MIPPPPPHPRPLHLLGSRFSPVGYLSVDTSAWYKRNQPNSQPSKIQCDLMVNCSSHRQTDPGSKTVRLNCLFTSCVAWTLVSWLSLRHPLHPQLTCRWNWNGRQRLANQQAPTRRTTPSTASFNWQFRVTSFSGNSVSLKGPAWSTLVKRGEREKVKKNNVLVNLPNTWALPLCSVTRAPYVVLIQPTSLPRRQS